MPERLRATAQTRRFVSLYIAGCPNGALGGEFEEQRSIDRELVQEMSQIRTPSKEDGALEAVVLSQLLVLHPAQLTRDELLRAIAAEPDDFAQRDSVERAVDELAAAGLAHRHGDFVIPSRAALRFDELLGD
jgi:hypothetical protein